MWARVHKVDRIRPQPTGGAIILIEDERSRGQLERFQPLFTLIAIARVLDARQVLQAKFGGKGEIRYAVDAAPSFLAEAVARAGASVSDRSGERIAYPAAPASVDSVVDVAFSDLAHVTRGNAGVDMATTLQRLEIERRKSPLDRETSAHLYWPAVFELAAVAGELARARGGRWIEVREMPVPFAMKFPDNSLARPVAVAIDTVENKQPTEPTEPTEPDVA